MKRLFIIVLSLFLLHAGVAWAIEACLQHDGHADHAASATHSDSHARPGIKDPHEPITPVIHCVPVSQQFGPAARAALIEIHRADKVGLLYVSSLHGALSASPENDLWLGALFKRTVAISLPIDLSRHLFLSVLQV